MSPLLVFNELSADPPAHNEDIAASLLAGYFRVVLDRRVRQNRILVIPSYFLQMPVSPGFSVGRWLNVQGPRDPDRRRLTKTLLDRAKYYEEYLAEDNGDGDDSEYRYSDRTTLGFLVAHRTGGLALSFRSTGDWETHSVSIEKTWIEEDDVHTRLVCLRHASVLLHLDAHSEWLERESVSIANGGAELWQRKTELFPQLDFCESVCDQLIRLSLNDRAFKETTRGLRDLQDYCDTWATPYFDIHALGNASGESGPTLDMYSSERTFLCPDGQYRIFEWHLKRGRTRIHFIDFPETKRILVGYAGPHLPIASM